MHYEINNTYIYTHIPIRLFSLQNAHIQTHTYVQTYVCTSMCTHTHTHTHTLTQCTAESLRGTVAQFVLSSLITLIATDVQ